MIRSSPRTALAWPAFAPATQFEVHERTRDRRVAARVGSVRGASASGSVSRREDTIPYGRRKADRDPVILDVRRFVQPDDVTCGPTCLTQVYRYYGFDKDLRDVITETPRNPDGGTLAVFLGTSALRNGFGARLYSYNLRVFDPTWRQLRSPALVRRLAKRRKAMESSRLRRALAAYEEFLTLGGRIVFREFSKKLLVDTLDSGHPILCGLSATYLYSRKREVGDRCDDIKGMPVGHFVVICGYYPRTDRFIVRDPSSHIPFSRSGKYTVESERLLAAILLGDVTYDADLLVLSPRK